MLLAGRIQAVASDLAIRGYYLPGLASRALAIPPGLLSVSLLSGWSRLGRARARMGHPTPYPYLYTQPIVNLVFKSTFTKIKGSSFR